MKVTEHKLDNGQSIRLQSLTGTVISASTSTTTSIHQSAPEVLNRYTVLPGQIHSRTHTKHSVWLRLEDGHEHSVDLDDLSLPVREGHVVSLVYGGPTWSGTTWLFGARNHTTGKVFCDVLCLKEVLRQWKMSIGIGRSFLTWTLTGALLPGLISFLTVPPKDRLVMAAMMSIVGAVVSFFCWLFFGMMGGFEGRAAALTEEISELGLKALKAEPAPRREESAVDPSTAPEMSSAA
ncbi:MAG TPA: hypothetical protein VFR90_17255 [Methylibium sp.]|uniref:hypothetical protein n=1 Tax=Methylibium sp. TaxID=2067992 RepID=UPI002DBA6A89|nr:hypothetical protein [Methylibium sp.]HEU4460872.1 hypothetical protein [Methylibium sp.]